MKKRPLMTALVVLTLGMMVSTSALARMYRYTDESGQVVISNTVPQEAAVRGYEILNSSGRVVERIAPAPTAEEVAAREAERQRQEQAERQRQADAQLLRRYSNPDDAVQAMGRRMQEMQSMIQLKRGNVSSLSGQLDSEQERAANLERAGQTVPDALLLRIERLQAQIRDIEQEIEQHHLEAANARQEFIQDIERLEAITDRQRSLPLPEQI
ncbi:MAG: DUF4124 domain-containing protein [Marinobacter sp.]|nr:DUF4124 domain-containing protein [Marinobacter sp.]